MRTEHWLARKRPVHARYPPARLPETPQKGTAFPAGQRVVHSLPGNPGSLGLALREVAFLLQLLALAKENAELKREVGRLQEQLTLLQRELDQAVSVLAQLHSANSESGPTRNGID